MNRTEWTNGIMAEVRNIESKNAQTYGAVIMPDRVSLMDISKPYAPINVTVTLTGAIHTWETACAVAYCRMNNYNVPDEVTDEDYADDEDWDVYDEDEDYEDDEDDDDGEGYDSYWGDDEDEDDEDILTLADTNSGDRVLIDGVAYIVCEVGTWDTTVYNLSTNQREELDSETEIDEII